MCLAISLLTALGWLHAVGRSAVAAPSAASQQIPHQPAQAPAAPQPEAAPVKVESQPVTDAADSSPEQQAEGPSASAASPEPSAQIDSDKNIPTKSSSAPPKQVGLLPPALAATSSACVKAALTDLSPPLQDEPTHTLWQFTTAARWSQAGCSCTSEHASCHTERFLSCAGSIWRGCPGSEA